MVHEAALGYADQSYRRKSVTFKPIGTEFTPALRPKAGLADDK